MLLLRKENPIPCSNKFPCFFSVLALDANSTFGFLFQSAKVYDDKPVLLFIVSSPVGLPYSSIKRMDRTPTPIRIHFNEIKERN